MYAGDGDKFGKVSFSGEPAVAVKPVNVVGRQAQAVFDAAMISFCCREGRALVCVCGGCKAGSGLTRQFRAVGLEDKEVVTATLEDRSCDLWLCADGVDGDERAGAFRTLEEEGSGSDFIGLFCRRLLSRNQVLPSMATRSARLFTFTPRSTGRAPYVACVLGGYAVPGLAGSVD